MRAIISIGFLLLLTCCRVRELPPAEYMSWVKDASNGLRVSKSVGIHTFVLQFKPCEFEALLHTDKQQLTSQTLKEKIAVANSLQYFTFCIQSPEHKDPAASVATDESDYNQRLNYLMFEMQQDFSLIDGKDTLPCIFYHYERNYNLSSDNNILLGFEFPPGKKRIADKTIIYNDHLLNTGPVLLAVKKDAIASIPTLKLPN